VFTDIVAMNIYLVNGWTKLLWSSITFITRCSYIASCVDDVYSAGVGILH